MLFLKKKREHALIIIIIKEIGIIYDTHFPNVCPSIPAPTSCHCKPPNHAIIGTESHHNQYNPLQFISHKRKKEKKTKSR